MAGFARVPILDIRAASEAAAALPGAHLALLPGPDPDDIARLARAMGRPVIKAAEVAMNPTALAHHLLDLAEAPERIVAPPPPDPGAEAAALLARYRAWAAEPARIAPPARI
jgi:hypothetical protein